MTVLVAYGSKSPAERRRGSRALAQVLPNAQLREIEGQTHKVSPKVLSAELAGFFAGERTSAETPLEVRAAG